ncbi:hypothetical protein Tcan_14331 [Toxocara canis]|uniref:Uncharacterized protein n=1 Tax=Toxocara canis TaxID=6265 RepID=A0A0B2UZN1_TOXCA|nr:hypothetical protein Tcan_14331 [Toxocara canis]
MPRLKKKSDAQRAREAKEAYRAKKECVRGSAVAIDSSNESGKRPPRSKIDADGDKAGRSGVVNGQRREELVINTSATAEGDELVMNTSTTEEGEERVINTSRTAEPLCGRLKKIALNSPHPPALPANESLPDVIAEHLQLVQAIIRSELGEGPCATFSIR